MAININYGTFNGDLRVPEANILDPNALALFAAERVQNVVIDIRDGFIPPAPDVAQGIGIARGIALGAAITLNTTARVVQGIAQGAVLGVAITLNTAATATRAISNCCCRCFL